MSTPDDVEKYLSDPELTISHLPQILAFLSEQDDEVQGYAVEALENCGAPRSGSIEFLIEQLASSNPLVRYWVSTLLGRWLSENDSDSEGKTIHQVEESLVAGIQSKATDAAARERMVLALGNLSSPLPETKKVLEGMQGTATPRMQRLIDTVLNKSPCS